MNTKQCSKCQETKTLDQFYKSYLKYSKDGMDYYCKYCRTGSSIKSHRGGNKKPCSVSLCENNHYAKGMCRNHYTRVARHGNTHSLTDIIEDKKIYLYAKQQITYKREYTLMYKYKVTKERYQEMIKDGCNVCGQYTERNLHIDHDHLCCSGEGATCGKCVRGAVCNRCNQTIGKYETGLIRRDNPLIDKIEEYLMKYRHKRYDEESKHNAIVADNLEEFMKKANNE